MKQKTIFNNPSNVLQYAANRYGDYIASFRGRINPYKLLENISSYHDDINEYFYQCPESNISATVYYNADNVKTINDDTFIIGSFLLSDVAEISIENIIRYELEGTEKILPLILLNSEDNSLITKMVIKK